MIVIKVTHELITRVKGLIWYEIKDGFCNLIWYEFIYIVGWVQIKKKNSVISIKIE